MTRISFEFPALLLLLVIAATTAASSRVADLDLTVVDSDLQPSITIEKHSNRVVEEYRVNNNLYMVKITPTVGAPYYLVDDDGSGELEYRRASGGRAMRVPQWTLFSW